MRYLNRTRLEKRQAGGERPPDSPTCHMCRRVSPAGNDPTQGTWKLNGLVSKMKRRIFLRFPLAP